MKTDNEIIAEFMGIEWDDFNKKHIDFTNDWNWLMPVVEKIHDVAPTDVQEINNESLRIFEFGGICIPISEVYDAVVEFIKWYNQQNQ